MTPTKQPTVILWIGPLLSIVLLLVSLFGCSYNLYPTSTPERYLATIDIQPILPGYYADTAKAKIIQRIQDAKVSIKAAFHNLDQNEITEALIQAYSKGIQVEYVTDYDYMGSPNTVSLVDAGIPCTFSGRKSRLNHTSEMSYNFCIIDDLYVIGISSDMTNYSFSASYGVFFDFYSEDFALDCAQEFDQIHAGVFGDHYAPYDSAPLKSSNTYYSYDFGEVTVDVYWGPQEAPISELIKEMYRAKRSIRFISDYVSHAGVYNALNSKRQHGFIVEGVIDFTGLGIGGSQANNFRDTFNGTVRTFNHPTQSIGANLFIIDDELPRETIILHSYGLQTPYHDTNFDNYIDFSDSYLMVIRRSNAKGTNHSKFMTDLLAQLIYLINSFGEVQFLP